MPLLGLFVGSSLRHKPKYLCVKHQTALGQILQLQLKSGRACVRRDRERSQDLGKEPRSNSRSREGGWETCEAAQTRAKLAHA